MHVSGNIHHTSTASLKLLGDYHILRIIDVLQAGPMRFCHVQRAVDNLNPVTLTDRLKKLEQADIVSRREDTEGDKSCVYYSLTPRGRDSLPILAAFDHFDQTTK